MRYFISYKHNGAEPKRLKTLQYAIRDALESKGHAFYSTYFLKQDFADNNMNDDSIILRHALKQIVDYDALLAVVDSAEWSTGMMIEFGYCVAIDKPIILFIKEDITAPYSFALAEKTVTYKDITDLQRKLIEL